MRDFNYHQPTEIKFGKGRIAELGETIAQYGRRCLLVSTQDVSVMAPLFEKIKSLLAKAGISVAHFDGVIPNPTTDVITLGADMAKKHQADVVLGVGGGSSMDSAKAIAVEATHEGSCWDYLFFKTPPSDKTLPVIAVSTTSGTGSHVTQVAVVTHSPTRDKSALYNSLLYPRVAIVDPDLMKTIPAKVSATTGFDVFCHSFESTLTPGASAYTDMMAREAITLVSQNLPVVLKDPYISEAREAMAWADTLAGLCIAHSGVALPHGMGMAIGGMYPQICHGEALSLVYSAFTRFTYRSAIKQFATVARIFDEKLIGESDAVAAEASCELIDAFMNQIGLQKGLKDFGIPKSELDALAKQCMVLPDYKSNPRVATEQEIRELLEQSYVRETKAVENQDGRPKVVDVSSLLTKTDAKSKVTPAS